MFTGTIFVMSVGGHYSIPSTIVFGYYIEFCSYPGIWGFTPFFLAHALIYLLGFGSSILFESRIEWLLLLLVTSLFYSVWDLFPPCDLLMHLRGFALIISDFSSTIHPAARTHVRPSLYFSGGHVLPVNASSSVALPFFLGWLRGHTRPRTY